MTNLPVSDGSSRAVEETAKTTRKAIEALEGLGGYLKDVFGTLPSDLVGILGGDWIKIRRAENLYRMFQKARKRLEAQGIKPEEPASLSLVLPIAAAAADESRDELQEIWAALLAASADPAWRTRFRNQFIEIAKALDPLDAAVLRIFPEFEGRFKKMTGFRDARREMEACMKITVDELTISLLSLEKLGLLSSGPTIGPIFISALGREFLRAVSSKD